MNRIRLDQLPGVPNPDRGNESQNKWTASKIIKIISAALALIYIISPIDFMPDLVPVIGWIDDILAGIGMAISLVSAFRTRKYSPNARIEQRANDIFGDDNY